MRKMILFLLTLLIGAVFFISCGPEPDPRPWEPWNEVEHWDTLVPGVHFNFQLEATINWDTAYFVQPASQGWSELYVSSDSASYYMLIYSPEYSFTGLDTIEIELMRDPSVWQHDPIEYYTHLFYFNIKAPGGE